MDYLRGLSIKIGQWSSVAPDEGDQIKNPLRFRKKVRFRIELRFRKRGSGAGDRIRGPAADPGPEMRSISQRVVGLKKFIF